MRLSRRRCCRRGRRPRRFRLVCTLNIRRSPTAALHDVLLFDVVAFLRSQDVIKKFPLPQRRRQFLHAKDLLCGPLLESAHETRKRRWVDASAGGAEEVQMVRHYDKGPYCPTMTRWSGFEFPANDGYDVRPREDRSPIGGACSDEVYRRFGPNRIESTKVLMRGHD